MKAPTRRSSTLRFVLGLVSAIVLVVIVVLWLVISDLRADIKARRERLHRAGVPMTFAELAPPPIPDDENAAPLYEEALQLLAASQGQRGPSGVDTFHMMASFLVPGSGVTRDGIRPGVERIVARDRAGLDALVAASRRPHCRFPIAYDQLSPFNFQDLDAWKMRDLSCELLARAILASEAGDSRAALDDCTACLGIARHLGDRATLNAAYTAPNVATRTYRVLREVINAGDLDVETCRALFEDVRRTDLRHVSRDMIAEGVPWVVWTFDVADREPKTFLRLMKARSVRARARAISYLSPIMYPIRLTEQSAYLSRVERVLSLNERPYRESARAYAQMMREVARTPRYELITRIYGSQGETGRFAASLRERLLNEQGGLLVALALKAYHAKHGSYPDSLAGLRAFAGWALPDDPFSGKAYGYARTGEGFRLWSWGSDLTGDRGNPGDYARPRGYAGPGQKGDLVWEFRR